MAGRIALRSFHDTKARLLRIRCTMQVCTTVCGNTDVIASGKPLSPSTTAMRMSLTPRALSSLTTLSQNLAPSVCSIHSPRTSFSPSGLSASATYTTLFLTRPSSRILDPQGVEKHHRIDRVEWPVLPLPNLVDDRVGDPADEVGRDFRAVQLGQVALDLPNRHAACIEAQNLVVEPVEPRLPLGDQLRFETAGPIAWHRNLDFAILGQHRLRTRTVAAVAFAAACRIALLVAEVVGQLRPERALDQRLLQLFEKTAISSQVFRLLIVSKKLIQQLRCNRRIGRHVSP